MTDVLPLGQPPFGKIELRECGGSYIQSRGNYGVRKNIKKNGGLGITLNVGELQHVVTATLLNGRNTNMAIGDL